MLKSLPRALLKVLVMMAGELNYEEMFGEEKSGAMAFDIAGQIFFAAFVIMVTTILLNLLIGFTVSDIQVIQNK